MCVEINLKKKRGVTVFFWNVFRFYEYKNTQRREKRSDLSIGKKKKKKKKKKKRERK